MRCVSALRFASAFSRRTASSVHARSCGRRGRRSTTGTGDASGTGRVCRAAGVCGGRAADVGWASVLTWSTLAEPADDRAHGRAPLRSRRAAGRRRRPGREGSAAAGW
ncbi:hypothetical protein [Ornithinimicrobium kibberense]|uniref:hypothetical protein n=1 Tax=Ornithinimicrobium kibberense TaxID=282060 RepID=UPI0036150B20